MSSCHRFCLVLTTVMDWTLCIVCQQKSHEILKCPLNAEGPGDKSEPYRTFLTNVKQFKELNQLPVPLKFGLDIDMDQLVRNQAKWHKSCHLKFSASKQRAIRKRERDEITDNSSATGKRRRLHRQLLDKSNCIFCGKQDGHLHEFRTLDADDNVRRMARDLQDTTLLTRIEGGDLTALEAKYHLACLAGLRNRHRYFLRQRQGSQGNPEEGETEVRAFVELINHVENAVISGTFSLNFHHCAKCMKTACMILASVKRSTKFDLKNEFWNTFPMPKSKMMERM